MGCNQIPDDGKKNFYSTLFGESIDLLKLNDEAYKLIFSESNGIWPRFENELKCGSVDSRRFVSEYRKYLFESLSNPFDRRRFLGSEVGSIFCDCYYRLLVKQLIESWGSLTEVADRVGELEPLELDVVDESDVVEYLSDHIARPLLDAIHRSDRDENYILLKLGISKDELDQILCGICNCRKDDVIAYKKEKAVPHRGISQMIRMLECGTSLFLCKSKDSPKFSSCDKIQSKSLAIESPFFKEFSPFTFREKKLLRMQKFIFTESDTGDSMTSVEINGQIAKLFGIGEESQIEIKRLREQIMVPEDCSDLSVFTRMNLSGVNPQEVEISEDLDG